MTAPDPDAPVDPVVCINARMVGREPQCGFPEDDHCEGCRSCPGAGNCVCRNTALDKHWNSAARDSFAIHAGATSWDALVDVVSHHTAETYRAEINAAITPLLDEIRRLTPAPVELVRVEVNDDQVVLACPHRSCGAKDSIREVDTAIRFNDIADIRLDGGQLEVEFYNDGTADWDHDHYECGACNRPVRLPKPAEAENPKRSKETP